eukprot:CAMPEP_0182552904 /NCGR_PEP_ID=MMETSP1323-20130603/49215_1 /TAXON_ID=236787 /ORGANISM="Florenciella parvula, Strain RCC1693" /LENGTH=183 /DNA_ID=CAMNT_0024764617 /DNA_START=15 /DNA_END=566 /DNA_ORIENTATION=+
MAAALMNPRGAAAAQAAAPPTPVGDIDLGDIIDKKQCFCLNEDPAHPHTNLFMGDERLFLQSDSDEQLLVHIQFNEVVKLSAISFVGPEDESAPLTIKVFANRLNLGFSDVEDLKAEQVLDLTPADMLADSQTNLYAVKFTRVTSLTLFIEENNGDDVSKLSGLKFFGQTVAGTNMSEFKKVG